MNIITKINNKKIISAMTALAVAGSLALAVPAMADTSALSGTAVTSGTPGGAHGPWGGAGFGGAGGMRMGGRMGMGQGMASSTRAFVRPTAFGTVTGISGDIITINSRQGFASTSPTTVLTVDATNATVIKDNATSTVSSIATGDMIAVQGTLDGTNVVATSIRDGIMRRGVGGQGGKGNGHPGNMGSSTSAMTNIGNGEPVVAGTISVINGTSLTITTKSNVTYTVDASSAKILKGQSTASISSVAVGDSVLVQGTINGTSVTATSVIDQTHASSGTGTAGAGKKGAPHGIIGGIGQFFMHIFGF